MATLRFDVRWSAFLLTVLCISVRADGAAPPSRASVEDAVREGVWCLADLESGECAGRLALRAPVTAAVVRAAVEVGKFGERMPRPEHATLHVEVVHVWPDMVPGEWRAIVLHAVEVHGHEEGFNQNVVRVRQQPGGDALLVPTPWMVKAAGTAGREWELAEATERLEAARALSPPGQDERLDDQLLEWYRGALMACEWRLERGIGLDDDCTWQRASVAEFEAMDATARGEAWLKLLRRHVAEARKRLEASDDRRSR